MRLNRSVGYGVAHTLFFVGVLVPVVLNSLMVYLLVAGLSALLMPLLWGKAPRREPLLLVFLLVSLPLLFMVFISGSILIVLAAAAAQYVLTVLITVPDPFMVGEPPTAKRGVQSLLGACVCGLVAFGAALLVARLPLLPISDKYARDFVKLQDRQMLARAFQHPLPPALRVTGMRALSIGWGPDGPPPVFYRIETDAPAWDAFAKQAGLKENLERDELGWPMPSKRVQYALWTFLSRDEYNQLYDQYFENPPLVSYFIERPDKLDRTYATFDTRTSPSLIIYVSTREPYLRELR